MASTEPIDAIDAEDTVSKDLTITLIAKEHAGPGEIADNLEKMAKVLNVMLGRMLAGGAFQNAGAAHPIAQQMFQCAATASAAAAGIQDQRRSLFLPGMPQRAGRA